jgi:hypothetical protein
MDSTPVRRSLAKLTKEIEGERLRVADPSLPSIQLVLPLGEICLRGSDLLLVTAEHDRDDEGDQ